LKKTPRLGAICRYVRLYGAISHKVTQRAKNDEMMKRFIRNFRALYANGGREIMDEACRQAARSPIETD
jgi:hypothetical protein